MTAKSRRRKRKSSAPSKRNYRFFTATRSEILIPAESLEEAKHEFQNKFGYWPSKENIHGEQPAEADGTDPTHPVG